MEDKKNTAFEVASKIASFVNNFNCDEKEFIKQMSMEHRTLQQSFTRLVFKWIEFCASNDYHFDGRNEATHKISKEMVTAFSKFKEDQMPMHWRDVKPSEFLPLI